MCFCVSECGRAVGVYLSNGWLKHAQLEVGPSFVCRVAVSMYHVVCVVATAAVRIIWSTVGFLLCRCCCRCNNAVNAARFCVECTATARYTSHTTLNIAVREIDNLSEECFRSALSNDAQLRA